jgi:hypothetical protein
MEMAEVMALTEAKNHDARIDDLLDLDRYPLDRLDGPAGRKLVEACRRDLAERGMYSLEGLVRPAALAQCIDELTPVFEKAPFWHKRQHNIYFRKEIPGLAADHPALRIHETSHATICADQFPESVVCKIYEWPFLADFLARSMGKPALYTMADPIARVNVMAYGHGETLNWHFDRSEFTTTLMLQSPEAGGEFEYRTALRSETDPNYEGVTRMLAGRDPELKRLKLSAGTLNVFKGKNTAHRTVPVEGTRKRITAVFSYYERPGVMFTPEERVGFYGRAQ